MNLLNESLYLHTQKRSRFKMVSDLIHYRRSTSDENCGNCRHTIIRWWLKRLECTFHKGYMAVGKKMICDNHGKLKSAQSAKTPVNHHLPNS
jgi:hypothetical protein